MRIKVKNVWTAALPKGTYARASIAPGQVGFLEKGSQEDPYLLEWFRKGRLVTIDDEKEQVTADNMISPTKKSALLVSGADVEGSTVAVAPPDVPEKQEESSAKITSTKVGTSTFRTIEGEEVSPAVRAGDPIKTAVQMINEGTVVKSDETPVLEPAITAPAPISPENVMQQLKTMPNWKKQVQFIEGVKNPDILRAIVKKAKSGSAIQKTAQAKLDSTNA